MAWTYFTRQTLAPQQTFTGWQQFYMDLIAILDEAPSLERIHMEGEFTPSELTAVPTSRDASYANGLAFWRLKDPTGERRPVYLAIGGSFGGNAGVWGGRVPIVLVGGEAPTVATMLPNYETSDPNVVFASISGSVAYPATIHLVDDEAGFHLAVVSSYTDLTTSGKGYILHLSWERTKTDPNLVAEDPAVLFSICTSSSSSSSTAGTQTTPYPWRVLSHNPGDNVIWLGAAPLLSPAGMLGAGSTTPVGDITSGWTPSTEHGATASPMTAWTPEHGWWRDPLIIGLTPGVTYAELDDLIYESPWGGFVIGAAAIFALCTRGSGANPVTYGVMPAMCKGLRDE